jgi:predicted ATPase/DNA-binding SARP family transcriptional activator
VTVPEVHVYLFGYPRVENLGQSVSVPRRKALALLAYLSVTQSHHSRDVLASLLWPEEESAKSYAFLRNALWVLHQTPVEPWVLATRHMVGLRADEGLWVDVVQFRRLLQTCQGHAHPETALCAEGVEALRTAVNLAREGFLAGFAADDSRALEEWQFGEADVLAQELALALERLSDHYETAGDVDAALLYAQRRLAAQTLDEGAYRRVMRLLAKRGDRAGALRVHEDCVRVLDLELSLEPAEETRLLAEEIRSTSTTLSLSPGSRPTRQRQFPVFRLPFVGRESDVSQILSLLAEEDCRLVTVTGTGGAGKTRLAVEAAAHASDFADGAVFVSLVDVESPSLAPTAILKSLGDYTESRADRGPRDAHGHLAEVARHLAGRNLLVVLDNVEHLGHDVRWLADLVASAPGPRFLATSRQELGVPGEWVFSLEGLKFPPAGSPTPAPQFPAVQLFVQAARRADAHFSPSPADIAAIGSIARLLQGNPLGIELAASWVRTMPCAAIEAEIAKSVDFLKTDQQLVPRRHRSLRAAFEGSWGLLDRHGRSAFRTLSVFRGGFTPDSALRVADVSLPGLASLVAKSLVERSSAGRYEMLEVVRQYADERLRTLPDEHAAVQNRHADYFLALLASQESRLKRSEQKDALILLAADEANVYTAWHRAASQGATEELARGAMGLFLFCDMTTRFAQGASLFRLAADASGEPARAPRAYFRGLEAWFTTFDDPEEASRQFQQSLDDAAGLSLNRDLAFVRVLLSFAGGRRAPSTPRAHVEDALRFFEEHGLTWEVATACDALTFSQATPAAALVLVDRSIAIRETLGDAWGVAMGRYSKAIVLEKTGDLEQAHVELQASAELRESLGLDPYGLWGCYLQMAAVREKLGRLEESAKALQKAFEIAARIRRPFAEGRTHELLARLDLQRRRVGSARQHIDHAVACYEAAHRAEDALRARQMLSETARPRKTG